MNVVLKFENLIRANETKPRVESYTDTTTVRELGATVHETGRPSCVGATRGPYGGGDGLRVSSRTAGGTPEGGAGCGLVRSCTGAVLRLAAEAEEKSI